MTLPLCCGGAPVVVVCCVVSCCVVPWMLSNWPKKAKTNQKVQKTKAMRLNEEQ